eukprot:m.26163 g.26163  ORF g.26163 m.26163 type:complete len:63 (-) comp15294_c0_seq1:157-345(-)
MDKSTEWLIDIFNNSEKRVCEKIKFQTSSISPLHAQSKTNPNPSWIDGATKRLIFAVRLLRR